MNTPSLVRKVRPLATVRIEAKIKQKKNNSQKYTKVTAMLYRNFKDQSCQNDPRTKDQ